MDLFSFSNINPNNNLLPNDGEVNYYGKCLNQTDADTYLNALLNNIDWRNDEAIIMGKKIITARKVGWYGLKPYAYTYSKTTKYALPFTEELMQLKNFVEQQTGEQFNSCLLNLYHNGNEGMAWHSDEEKELKKNGAIASISLGAERKFSFKHKVTKQTVSIILEHGSLLVMKGTTQTHWLHRLPPTKKVHKPRVNLTFRCMV